jgi:hypothetical protein
MGYDLTRATEVGLAALAELALPALYNGDLAASAT